MQFQKLYETVINESSLSRLHQLLSDDEVMLAILSRSRGDVAIINAEGNREISKSEKTTVNEQRYKELLKDIRNAGYGFVELHGGYVEDQNGERVPVVEKSVLVSKRVIGKPNEAEKQKFTTDMLNLVTDNETDQFYSSYTQDSILLKIDDSLAYIKVRDNRGTKDMEFDITSKKKFRVGPRDTPGFEYGHTKLVKGAHGTKRKDDLYSQFNVK